MRYRLLTVGFLTFLLSGCSSSVDYHIEILGLPEGQIVEKDSVTVSFVVTPEDWSERGYEVHFLLDGERLKIRKSTAPVSYRGFEEGAHAIIALVCDPEGVSLKTPSSIVIRNFFYRTGSEPYFKKDRPLLILHQPQERVFRGQEAMKILIDFRVLNAELGEGYRLHYILDGRDYYVEEERAIWTEEARRIGSHELTVILETAMGNPVMDNPLNRITRKFMVRER